MERPPLVIVKLGGSVITRKKENAHLRPKVLARLGRELSSRKGPLVILHGAGSFGHPDARRFHLAEAPSRDASSSRRVRGVALVSEQVRALNLAVLRALRDAGLNPVSMPPAPIALNRAGRLERFETGPFSDALDRAVVPVSFGDVVPDSEWGFSILSADTIAVHLARALHASRVIFVSDIDGVYLPAPPQRGRSLVVMDLSPSVMDALRTSTVTSDVTGGIRAKVRAMLELAEGGVRAGLISGLRHEALSRAVQGEKVYGSWAGPET